MLHSVLVQRELVSGRRGCGLGKAALRDERATWPVQPTGCAAIRKHGAIAPIRGRRNRKRPIQYDERRLRP